MISFTIINKEEQAKNIITLCTLKLKIININFFFWLKHIIMVKLTKNELKLTAGNRGIKNYQNMSRKKLLSIIVKSLRIIKNLSKKKWI